MSSILKALKQQQSPLVNSSSDLQPELLDSGSSYSRKPWRVLLAGVLFGLGTVLTALAIWLVWQWYQQNSSMLAAKPVNQPDYEIGESSPIPEISWPAAEVATSADVQQPTVVNPNPEPVNDERAREPLNMDEVSDELLAKFEQAVQQTATSKEQQQPLSVVPALAELEPSFQRRVNAFSYDGHMFVSDASQRWVELNNQKLYIGDRYQSMVVRRIEPQHVILVLDGNAFRVDALADWQPPQR